MGYFGYSLKLWPIESVQGHTHRRQLMLASLIMSCLPDADFFMGIAVRDLERVHNGISHSLPFGLLVSAFSGALLRGLYGIGFVRGFAGTFAFHTLHLVLDLLGRNSRGLLLMAPFSSRRYRVPFRLFYGVRWDEGLLTRKHLWTLVTETAVVTIILTIILRRGWTSPFDACRESILYRQRARTVNKGILARGDRLAGEKTT
jgi:membrane-bound metal-dependent hydrolase YbcI (DUF457 family)